MGKSCGAAAGIIMNLNDDARAEILEWEARQIAAVTERLFKIRKVYQWPRKGKLKDHRRHRERSRYSDEKKILKRVRNEKIRGLPVCADRLSAPGEFRRMGISFKMWL
jgi:hypothetical protein